MRDGRAQGRLAREAYCAKASRSACQFGRIAATVAVGAALARGLQGVRDRGRSEQQVDVDPGSHRPHDGRTVPNWPGLSPVATLFGVDTHALYFGKNLSVLSVRNVARYLHT